MSTADNVHMVPIRQTVTRGMVLLVLSSILIIAMLTPLEPVDYVYFALSSGLNVAAEVFIVIADLLLLLAGYWLASSLKTFLSVGKLLSVRIANACSRLSSLNVTFNRKGFPSLLAAVSIVVFWHVPPVLNAVLLQFWLHWIMHVSLFFAGVLICVGFTQLTPNMRLLSYLLGCKAMAVFGAYLLVSPVVVYGLFPYPEQAEAGAAMVAMCVASDATIIPLWLRRYFSRQ
jgi:cytochrome c oxidase assembly factor CtaG